MPGFGDGGDHKASNAGGHQLGASKEAGPQSSNYKEPNSATT